VTYYKVLNDGKACHGGTYEYPLPKGKRAGKWTPSVENLSMCSRGYHVCTAEQLPEWLNNGNEIYEAEIRGESREDGSKTVAESVRLVRRLEHGEAAGKVLLACKPELLIVKAGEICLAWGSATVRASGSATVEAWDSATVEASGSATVVKPTLWCSNNAKVTKLADLAVLIDRSQGGVKVYSAVPVENIVGDAS
jgi:hypothetical protein